MAYLTERMHMKVNEDEKEQWKDAARKDARTQAIPDPERRLSAWVRIVCNEAAGVVAQ